MLDRIRDLASEQWRIARDHDLIPPWPQKPDPALDHLRMHLVDLKKQEDELTVRARASGIRRTDVDLAANVFVWGHVSAPVLEGEEAVRAQLIDAIAADLWTLEHMAAVATDRRWRYRNDPSVPDTKEQQRYERNMSAIWKRAAATASVAGLRDHEQAELWGRDELGWINLFHETTYFYNERELEDRWHEYADPGTATSVTNTTAASTVDLQRPADPGGQPPSMQALMDRAADALNAEIRALGSEGEYAEYRIDCFLGAVVPAGELDDWSREAVAERDRQRAADSASALIEACGLDNGPRTSTRTRAPSAATSSCPMQRRRVHDRRRNEWLSPTTVSEGERPVRQQCRTSDETP
ncbi:hypothetical protein [Nocardia sp. CA-119907]|uniref:hypothetical protein n=1 Tax=Nocardia sp. CA-119907 TaxID=3239973 RepID=UPI003D9582CF